MKLKQIIESLQVEMMTESADLEAEITGVYIGDLLSLVMAKAKQGDLWITIQTHLNVIAVVDLLDLGAVLVAEGVDIEEETLAKANSLNIPILRSRLSAYDLAKKLSQLGL